MNIFVIGIGLIGGSMAKDIKAMTPNAVTFGIDTDENHLEEAIKLGLIDKKSSMEMLHEADVVIVAIPVDKLVKILP